MEELKSRSAEEDDELAQDVEDEGDDLCDGGRAHVILL
ncbi:hypothetical protein Rrhod_0620 [Rhodococcus rhodnii LMG 5362]|uniref:Uncharacterized protein n=1 Tax=Rhodococcus rhodnii LMG 5362 TaxID=1273125 RepID=R7WRL3_9NOCA|nr:hypothetical protein Rrhod_0620 [Rhodococcus rhodnii LMG 5362]